MFNWIIVIPLITLFATVTLAIVVIPWSRREPSRPVLDILIMTIALWSFGSVMIHSVTFPSTLFWMHFVLVCGLCTGALGVHFSAQFTQQRDRIAKPVVRIIYAVVLLLAVLVVSGQVVNEATLLPSGIVAVNFGTMAPLIWGIIGIGVLIAMFFLISTLTKSSQKLKRYLILPLVGYIVMCLGSLSNFIASSYPIEIAANFIFVSFITYGAIGTHLLKPVTRRSWKISLFVVFSQLVLCYIAVLTFCLEWLRISSSNSHLIAPLIVIAFGVVVFRPSRTVLLDTLSKILFPSIHNYKQALADIAKLGSSLAAYEDNLTRVLDIIIKVIKADGAILLLRNDETESFEPKYVRGLDPADLLRTCLSVDSPTIRHLEINSASIIEGEMEPYSTTNGSPCIGDSRSRELCQTSYCGVQGYQRLLAVLAIVQKPHNYNIYLTSEKKDFLILVCNQIAPIIGNVLLYQARQREITERNRLEEEQQKVAKLELIGTLAGGIAHDFNNLLTGIMGNISLAKRHIEPKSKAEDRLLEAEKASLRARDLIQQLLTFARGGLPVKKVVPIVDLLKESTVFALRGSKVRPEFFLPENLWPVEVDEGQINQVIHNIVINANEAMPDGGIINLSAKNMVIKQIGALPLSKGNYVEITIEDHGVGISKEHLPRIFDPYFTTKQKGSGLGLATVYSIIKNHGGYITVNSKRDIGTTFYIYLQTTKKPVPAKEEAIAKTPIHGKGRILVMDDEEVIRELLRSELTEIGYEVELAEDGDKALEQYTKAKESGQPFDAVILDLTIPGGMGGKEVIKKLLEIDPSVKAIVSSGYSTDSIMSDFKGYGFSGVITKPYTMEQLEETLHSTIRGKGE